MHFTIKLLALGAAFLAVPVQGKQSPTEGLRDLQVQLRPATGSTGKVGPSTKMSATPTYQELTDAGCFWSAFLGRTTQDVRNESKCDRRNTGAAR